MICEKKSIEYGIELVTIIGYSSDVSNLQINDVLFGDAKGNSRIDLSMDRQVLSIYTEDSYIATAKILVDNIDVISFKKCEEVITLY